MTLFLSRSRAQRCAGVRPGLGAVGLAAVLLLANWGASAWADGMPVGSGLQPVRTPPVRGKGASAPLPSPATPPGGMDASMSLDLRQASIGTALRLISEVSQANIVATQAASDRELSLYLNRATAAAALDAVTRAAGLWVRWRPSSQSYLVMTADEYQRDLTVFGEERSEVFALRHHNVVAAAHALRALFGHRVRLQTPQEEPLGESMKTTDLRRNAAQATPAMANTRFAASGGTGVGTGTGTDAQGVQRTQLGGLRMAGAGTGGEAGQLAAAGAAVGAAQAQVEAAQQGQEAPIFLTYNRLHNLLVLRTGDERALAQARDLLQRLDLPARQVMLEMRIIQVRMDDEFRRSLDMDFFSNSTATGTATGATNQPVNPLTGASTGPRTVGSLGDTSVFDKATGLLQFISNRIRVRLQLLEENGRVQTLAKPLLLASNNEPARLFIGEEVVLTTGASAQTTTGTTGATNTVITAETEKRNIGTTLVIHPRINDDRTVTLTIDQESSERVAGGTTIPLATGTAGDGVIQYPIDTVNTATVQAVAQAKDGLTIAVGGLIKISKSKTEGNVPGFSRIPLLGELFKSDQRVDERSELMLIITPHVLDSAEEGQRLSTQLGGHALKAQSLGLRTEIPAQASDPRQHAQTMAELALAGLDEAQPMWESDPAVKRLPDDALEGLAPRAVGLGRARVLGAWQWGRLHAVAVELADGQAEALAAPQSSALPGRWLALALEPTTRVSTGGPAAFTRRAVWVTDEAWPEVARRWRP